MTVRFSSNQILDAGVQGMDNALSEAMSWNRKVTTGKQYAQASDNAYAVSRGVRLDFDISRLDMFKANQNFVASSHANAQTQMDSLVNEMISLKQLFVQSQSGALNPSNYKALKVQAEQILIAMKQQMTATDGTGSPIFGDEVNQVQIEPNVNVDSGIKFSDSFGGVGDVTKVDVLTKINEFVAFLGQKAGVAGINSTGTASSVSTGLTSAYNQLQDSQTRSGLVGSLVSQSASAVNSLGTQLAATTSTLLDTDMAAATASFMKSQAILNAAQSLFSRLQSSNLFSKM